MRLFLFTFATLLPAVLLVIGAFWGGPAIWFSSISIGVMWAVIDRFPDPADESELPVGDNLLILRGLLAAPPICRWGSGR